MLRVCERIPTQMARAVLVHGWAQWGQQNRPAFGNLVEQREDAPGDFRQHLAHGTYHLLRCDAGSLLVFAPVS